MVDVLERERERERAIVYLLLLSMTKYKLPIDGADVIENVTASPMSASVAVTLKTSDVMAVFSSTGMLLACGRFVKAGGVLAEKCK